MEKGEAVGFRGACAEEARDGGGLRSGPESAARLPAAVQPGNGRDHSGALEAVAKARSDQHGVYLQAESEDAALPVPRLRMARPIPSALWRADPVEAVDEGRHRARVRGVRR